MIEHSLIDMLVQAWYQKEHIFHHYSDLYIFVTPLTTRILEEWCVANQLDKTIVKDVQEVRQGHWLLLRERKMTGFNPEFAGRDPIGGYQCSNCKEEAIFDCNDEFALSRYCPNCGAKMDKEGVRNIRPLAAMQ